MFDWQTIALFVLAAFSIGCLLGVCIMLAKLVRGIRSVGVELSKLNSKLESVEVMNRDESKDAEDKPGIDDAFTELESALSNFEKLKRIDAEKS